MKQVTIVIVNWNGIADTRRCLDSVLKLHTDNISLTTVVVDNGSDDGSQEILEKNYPWVTCIPLKKNLGFTGGNNAGMRYAVQHGAAFVWLLNNDTLVAQDALKLVKAFDDPMVGIAGSKIYFAAGHEYHGERYNKAERGKVFWYAGGIVDWKNMYASHRGVDEVDAGQYDKTIDTPFVSGCSMMLSRRVVEAIGYLDPKFYLYLEDLDYCLRSERQGFRLVYYPPSVIWHVNAGSTGGAGNPLHEYYITRNRLLVGMRYAPFRTKAALIREALRFACLGPGGKRKAVLDAAFGRWGKQYEPKKFS